MTASHPLERGVDAATWLAAPAVGPADVAGLVVRGLGAVAAASATGCGLSLALRRLSGAIEPAGPVILLGAATAGVVLVACADAARRAGGSIVAPLAARGGIVLAVVTLALPPRPVGPAGWLAFAAAAVVTAGAVVRMPRHPPPPPPAHRDTRCAERGRRPADRRKRRRGLHRQPRPGMLRQRFERRELTSGAEHVRGRLVVAVPAGARAGYGHLGFCPAFTATPAVEVTTAYDGVEATVTAAEVLPWGVRVECRLAEPAEESLEIPVELVARAAGPTH